MTGLKRNFCYACISIYKVTNSFFDAIKNPSSFRKKPLLERYENRKIHLKIVLLSILAVFFLTESLGWFYNEFIGSGALFEVGKLEHQVKQYDHEGEFVEDFGELSTIVYEDNMGVTTKNSKYIEVENIGTLDMEFNITFQLDGTISEAGAMYYRIYDVTDAVYASTMTAELDTYLKAYAYHNPIDQNIENDTVRPITNMSLIQTSITTGEIKIEGEASDHNPRYYRVDYGMYESANSGEFTDKSIAVHAGVYSTQLGKLTDVGDGIVWIVNNESHMRSIIETAGSGDTIRLGQSFTVEGNLNINKNVNLDLDGYSLEVTGDLVFDYVANRDLHIDASDGATLDVNNNFVINTPQSNIHLEGDNDQYDIFVGNEFKVNTIQTEATNGIYFEAVRVVQNKATNMPADLIVMSNSKVTVGHNVVLNFVTTTVGATNIELINNGSIIQVQFQDMTLLTTFTKPQIFIYNLAEIHGVVEGASIVLPETATPYVSPTQGNTLIIRGINSNDITVEGSEHFDEGDIGYIEDDGTVEPIEGEDNAYIVNISEPEHTVENLLTNYFLFYGFPDVPQTISEIEKLVVKTFNVQYVENHDFDFMKSASMASLEYLSLANARVSDGASLNRIPADAMANKTSLEVLILPQTVTEIGENAFANVELGKIPTDPTAPFYFLEIPSNVSLIEENAFSAAKYVKFNGAVVPTVENNAFDNSDSGSKIFVGQGFVDNYRDSGYFNEANIFRAGELSDNRLYFVYPFGGGVGISLAIDPSLGGSTIGIPLNITLDSYSLPVNDIGPSAFRHIPVEPGGAELIIPDTTQNIGSHAFYDMAITSANFANIINIGNYAFYNSELVEASFDQALNIGENAFANSSELLELTFDNVKDIGDGAFSNTPNVARVTFNGTDTKDELGSEVIDLDYGNDALFSNWGQYINGRLRVYVPNGNSGSGNPYLQLYKERFSENAEFIYEQGEFVGDYFHPGIALNLHEYTVKEVTLDDHEESPVTGYEIISYQGPNLDDSYELPSELTVNGNTLPVISIGQRAYRHFVKVGGDQIHLVGNNLIRIGENAFLERDIRSIEANNVVEVLSGAFASSDLRIASFENLQNLGSMALADLNNLNYLHLGNVENIGSQAVREAHRLYQIFITNDAQNLDVAGNAFTNLGQNTANRTRIYVPEGSSSIDYFKNIFTGYESWVYATGEIIGSFVHNNYDLGEYAVREVTLDDYQGNPVTGYEIISYQGANLMDIYEIPNEVTVNASTMSVISIGRDAYANVAVEEEATLNITNNSIMQIGSRAFKDLDGIDIVNLQGVTVIGSQSFANTSVSEAYFINLDQIGSGAFSNVSNLAILDLGRVQSMPAETITNAPLLHQVFFTADENVDMLFNNNAFSNVGDSSNDRLRFYVTDDLSPGEEPFFELYRDSFAEEYRPYFFPRGEIIGSYSPANISADIGIYSVREVTLDNHESTAITGWELIEYHGSTLTSAYEIPENLTVGSDTYNFISVGDYAFAHTSAAGSAEISINHDHLIQIGDYAFYELVGIRFLDIDTLVSIGDYAFRYGNVRTAEFENLLTVGDYAFANISQLRMINLGSVQEIGDGMLYNNSALHQLFIDTTANNGTIINISIGTDAFYNVGTALGGRFRIYVPLGESGGLTYAELYQNTLPASMNDYIFSYGYIVGSYVHYPFDYDIGAYNVRDVSLLNHVDTMIDGLEIIGYHGANITDGYEIPLEFSINAEMKSVISIGMQAFINAQVESGHSWHVETPDSVFHIDDYAFHGLPINSFNGHNFTRIGDYAFEDVTLMTSATMTSIIEIGEGAFHNIPTLALVSLGTGTLTIGDYAFYVDGANDLTDFYIEAVVPPSITATTLPAPGDIEVFVQWDSWHPYRNADYWEDYNITRLRTAYLNIFLYDFINGNEIIITGFSGQHNDLTIPDNFTLDGVDYPVTAIAAGTFHTSGNMQIITLPQYLNRIPNDLFGNNDRMREIYVHGDNDYFSSINGILFDKDEEVILAYPPDRLGNSYTLPSSTLAINSYAFSNLQRLATLNINSEIQVISQNAFYNNEETRNYNFNSDTPPFFTSFDVFPMHNQLSIEVPTAGLDNYLNYFALQRYVDYIDD